MVISHKFKYLFLENPHTGTSSISQELCNQYDGIRILRKHSFYSEFLRVATPEERRYFVFAGIRNPLDEAVSLYFRLKTNHRGQYTDPKRLRGNDGTITPNTLKRFHFIQDNSADFTTYFQRFFKLPYIGWICASQSFLNSIIRFENLQDDFSRVLAQLGIEQKQALPTVNVTGARKRDYQAYYPSEIRKHARWVFGPYMKQWEYAFPADWNVRSIPLSSQLLFHIIGAGKRFYWQQLKWGSSLYARAFRALRYGR